MMSGVIEIQAKLDAVMATGGISFDDLSLAPDVKDSTGIKSTSATDFVVDELGAEALSTLMAGVGAAWATRAALVAAVQAAAAHTIAPAIGNVALLGLGRTAATYAAGESASVAQTIGSSVVFGPAGIAIGITVSGATLYRGWRKAKRRNARMLLDQASAAILGLPSAIRLTLDDACDEVVNKLRAAVTP